MSDRVFNDFLLHNIINCKANIEEKPSLVNTIRACLTIDTGNDTHKVPKVFKDNDHLSDWYTKYREGFGESRINKYGLTNVISHAVNEYAVSVVNYITYGLRDQYVRLLKKQLHNDNNTCERIALRVLETFEASNTGRFSFGLSSADKFTLSEIKKRVLK